MGCERGGPLQKCKTPNPRKVLGRVLGEVPARNGVLGDVLGEVLVLLVLEETHSGRDVPGTSGTQTPGYPGQKLYASGLFSVVLDKEWPGCPGIWVGTSRTWKNFMPENFGLIFRTL